MSPFKDQKIRNLEQEVQRLTLALETANVDRDYYRSQRDRLKDNLDDLDVEMRLKLQLIVELRQAMRQIVTAIESNSDDRYSAILRIARTNSGA